MRSSIENTRSRGASSTPSAPHTMVSSSSHSHSNGYGQSQSQGSRGTYPYHSGPPGYSSSAYNNYGSGHAAGGYRGHAASDLRFKGSPFYVIETRIGDVRTCEGKNITILYLGSLGIRVASDAYVFSRRGANMKFSYEPTPQFGQRSFEGERSFFPHSLYK